MDGYLPNLDRNVGKSNFDFVDVVIIRVLFTYNILSRQSNLE